MNKYMLSFMMLLHLFTSCNGQIKKEQAEETPVEKQMFKGKNTKLTKTQGSNEYQNVHRMIQDKDGNLWFGTTGEGVYRYDGKEFTQFTTKDGLSNNSVWSILEDNSGNIWFGTDDGVSRYDGKSISKIPFTLTPSNGVGVAMSKPGKNSVWSILQDRNGVLWFGTSHDLYCYDGKTFRRFLDNLNISNTQNLQLTWIQCLLEDRKGNIWMGSGPFANEGVIQFDGNTITSSKPNGDGWIRYMVEDKRGHIWFSGRHNGVFRYDGEAFNRFTEKTNIGSAIFMDHMGNIWFDGGEKINSIESFNGLWRYNGKTFENFTTKDGMGKNSVWSMLEDKDGNIWIGTRDCGLYRYDGQSFESFSD